MKKSLIAMAVMAAASGSAAAGWSRLRSDEPSGHELRALNAGGLMAEIDSREATLIAAGDKVQTVQGRAVCLVFHSPATAAWAQNDTFASGMRIPKGSRLLNACSVSHGALGASVTLDVGLRQFADGTVIDADGIASNLDVSAAGRTAANNGALVATGVDSVTEYDAEPYCTLEGANPTDDIQIRVEIWYLPPG